jgi:transposase
MNNQNHNMMESQRIIGLDCHPDVFTGALVAGTHPSNAQVFKYWDKLPLGRLQDWAKKHTQPQDLFILEASGNSFHICSQLAQVERKAIVIESGQTAKLKDAYCSNDKRSAVRIAESWLTGKAKVVWQPDPLTLERRELWGAYRKSIKRNTQMRNRIKSFLSDHGVRLGRGSLLIDNIWEKIWAARQWSALQRTLLENYREDFVQAHQQRSRLKEAIVKQVFEDPNLLKLVRLSGVRDVIAFAISAMIGDVHRFENPRKLVAYFGLNPSLEESGNSKSSNTELKRHGRKDGRTLLLQGAQSILKSEGNPLRSWGLRLMARKGCRNKVAVAMARKLVVAIWYMMKGYWQPLTEVNDATETKIKKMIREIQGLKKPEKAAMIEDLKKKLLEQGIYLLNPLKTFTA